MLSSVQEFFKNDPTLIGDGTYFFIGKSSSSEINRPTYRGKKYHYAKFMSTVLPDSYIIDIIGPFQGTLNDVGVTKETIKTDNSIVT